MKRTLSILLCLFLTSATLFAEDHPVFENYEDPGIEDSGVQEIFGIPRNALLKVRVKTRNFTEEDLVKLTKAIEILEQIMNSNLLRKKILEFNYKGTTSFHQNNNLTNQEIYQLIMRGAEVLKPDEDYTMDFDLTMYRSWNPWSKVKGYTKPDTMRIWIHSKFYRLSSWTPVDIAANLAHEWIHKVGFGHDYYYNDDRPFSVPYAVGSLVAEVASELNLE